MQKIDFGYAFSAPHVITLSRPSASEKVIVSVQKEGLKFSYSYSNLKTAYPLSWTTLPLDVHLFMDFSVNDHAAHTNGWVISNPGWYDGETEDLPPMANEEFGIGQNSMKKVTAVYSLNADEYKTGYFLLPYHKYLEHLSELKNIKLEKEMKSALLEWERLLKRGTQITIADKDLLQCYYSCVADLFVMREKIGKYYRISCGTEVYRSANSGEPLEAEMLLDNLGYTKEAETDLKMYLEAQENTGCWVSSKGWEHEVWGLVFNKANAVMEHYYLTLDRSFLEENYQRMFASTMFNHKARCSTENAKLKSERGLMPNGMGDCGMMNGEDYYGVFYPHNCLSVAADGKTLEAAKILNKTNDIPLLTAIYNKAKTALITSMRENLIHDGEYTIIPSVAGVPLNTVHSN